MLASGEGGGYQEYSEGNEWIRQEVSNQPFFRPVLTFFCERTRKEFTAQEIENLCRYIAAIVPDSKGGGRRGDNLYKGLVELVRTYPIVILD